MTQANDRNKGRNEIQHFSGKAFDYLRRWHNNMERMGGINLESVHQEGENDDEGETEVRTKGTDL